MSSSAAVPAFPPSLETVLVEVRGAWALVTIRRAPVNGMNLTVWRDLLSALTALESRPEIRGAIFASGLEKDIFTAGNDLTELYSKSTSESRFREFWTAQTTLLTRLYSTRLATVAAIRGACPAGGCAFALCCDYRLMTSDVPGASIGLNEAALGISVPKFWAALFRSYVGASKAELVLTTGRMMSPQEAVQAGLVHELATKAELMAKAEQALAQFLRVPDAGRVQTKLAMRAEFARQWQDFCAQEAAMSWQLLSSEPITKALGAVLAKLSGGAKKPKAKL